MTFNWFSHKINIFKTYYSAINIFVLILNTLIYYLFHVLLYLFSEISINFLHIEVFLVFFFKFKIYLFWKLMLVMILDKWEGSAQKYSHSLRQTKAFLVFCLIFSSRIKLVGRLNPQTTYSDVGDYLVILETDFACSGNDRCSQLCKIRNFEWCFSRQVVPT